MSDTNSILAINAGSSSIKFALYSADLSPKLSGQLEGLGTAPHLAVSRSDGTSLVDRRWAEGGALPVHTLMAYFMDWLEGHLGRDRPAAIGHRVATGGLEHSAPVIVTPEVLEKLHALEPLAPLHQPLNLEPIEALTEIAFPSAAGRLLRYCLSPDGSRRRRKLCRSAPARGARRPPLRLSWALL